MGKYIPVEPEKWGEMVKAMAEVTRLKAEVERLRKAGDAIAICLCGGTTEEYNKQCALNWLAAKEGKQP